MSSPLDTVTAQRLFVSSKVAEQFERGNPAFISGKSGEEIARII